MSEAGGGVPDGNEIRDAGTDSSVG